MTTKHTTICPSVALRDNNRFEIHFRNITKPGKRTSSTITWKDSNVISSNSFKNFNSCVIGAISLGYIATRVMRTYNGDTKVFIDEYANSLASTIDIDGHLTNDIDTITMRLEIVFASLIPTVSADTLDIKNYLKTLDMSSLNLIVSPFESSRKISTGSPYEKFNNMTLFDIIDGYLRLEREVIALKA